MNTQTSRTEHAVGSPGMRPSGFAKAAFLLCLGMMLMPAAAGAVVRVSVDVNAPPARILFQSEPGRVGIAGTQAYFVGDYDDADVYCAGPWWYAYRSGYWYRSRGWRGPWACISLNFVPREVIHVGPRYRHYRHVSAGEWRENHGWRGREWRDDRRDDRRHARETWREARRDEKRERHGNRGRDRNDD